MVDVLDLRNKVGQVRLERLRIVVMQDVEIDPMTPTQEEGGSVPVTVNRETQNRQLMHGSGEVGKTYLSRCDRTTRSTSGRGQIVSRLPRGICRTKVVELGTTVTILEPRSTARLIELSPPAPPIPARRAKDSVCSAAAEPDTMFDRGRNLASWEYVV